MSTARESQLSAEPSFVTCFNLGRERGGGREERDQQISASTEGTMQATFTLESGWDRGLAACTYQLF